LEDSTVMQKKLGGRIAVTQENKHREIEDAMTSDRWCFDVYPF
jgi:hypothetical protein